MVDDWSDMRQRVRKAIKELDEVAAFIEPEELDEWTISKLQYYAGIKK